jgi:hypothetical protein
MLSAKAVTQSSQATDSGSCDRFRIAVAKVRSVSALPLLNLLSGFLGSKVFKVEVSRVHDGLGAFRGVHGVKALGLVPLGCRDSRTLDKFGDDLAHLVLG